MGPELYIDNWEAIHFYLGQTPAGKQSAFSDPLVGFTAKGADIEAVWNTDAWLQNGQQQTKYGFPMEPRTTENCKCRSNAYAYAKSIGFAFYGTHVSVHVYAKQ